MTPETVLTGSMDAGLLWESFLYFFKMSFFSIGGYLTVIPALGSFCVERLGLLSWDEFAAAIAIGNAAPGPNYLLVVVMGWFMGGLLGAFALFLGASIPYILMTSVTAKFSEKFAASPLMKAYKTGMGPVAIGLYAASSIAIVVPVFSPLTGLVLVVVMLLTWKTHIPMYWLLFASALFGAFFL